MRLVSDTSRAAFRRVLASAAALSTIGGAVGVAAVSTRADLPTTNPPDPSAVVPAGTATVPAATPAAVTTTALKKNKKKKPVCYAIKIRHKGAKKVKVKVKVPCKAPRPIVAPIAPRPLTPAPSAPPATTPSIAPPPASPSPPTTPPPAPAPPGSGSQVQIGDDDMGASIFVITGARPGQVEERCIRVVYMGTDPADVRLYVRGAPGALGTYVTMTITPGSATTGGFPSCAGFSAAGAAAWSGTLSSLSTHADWTGALVLPSPGNDRWQPGEGSAYRITAQLADDNGANGGATPLSSGSFEIVWEARD